MVKTKNDKVTFCYCCKKHKDSNLFRPNAGIQVCFDCAKQEFDRLSAKGLRVDEHKAIKDYSDTIAYLEKVKRKETNSR